MTIVSAYYFFFLFFSRASDSCYLHSFPTRRSSDLLGKGFQLGPGDLRVNPPTQPAVGGGDHVLGTHPSGEPLDALRSEEHTSELQSRGHLVCRLLLEKKKNKLISTKV